MRRISLRDIKIGDIIKVIGISDVLVTKVIGKEDNLIEMKMLITLHDKLRYDIGEIIYSLPRDKFYIISPEEYVINYEL